MQTLSSCFLLLGMLLAHSPAIASLSLSIHGRVTDQTGKPVPQALVTAISEVNPLERESAVTDEEGRYELSWVVTAIQDASQAQPQPFQLFQNWPNPFNPSTQLGYALDRESDVELAIFSVLGQKVRVLDRGFRPAGVYHFSWDGRDDAGRLLGAGVYLYRLQTGSQTEIRKMAMLDGAVALSGMGSGTGLRTSKPTEIHSNTSDALYTVEVTAPRIRAYRVEHVELTNGQVYDITVERLPEVDEGIVHTTVYLPGGTTMEFVWIEPGTFLMGSPESEEGRRDDEEPQHEVTISRGFWLGKYELTQGQWEAVMGTTPWSWSEGDGVRANPDHPAVYISRHDVQEFIGRLNMASGEEIYRLPTEAEWEYACRAGTTTRWSFGDEESLLGEYAWYSDNAWDTGLEYAQPVGQKRPNPWGLYDVHGNVLEWCQDWYGSYSSRSQTDPTGPAAGSDCILRGGYYRGYAQEARSANRYIFPPLFPSDHFGARLLRVADPAVLPNRAPEADAGVDQRAEAGVTVQLDGSSSWDVNGDTLRYRWTIPAEVSLSDMTVARPAFAADMPGTYRIGLVVNDGQVESALDEVVITVLEPPLTVELPGGVTMEFVWIEPGTFVMGSPDWEDIIHDSGKPQHEVTISQGFWLGKYELTQEQWEAVMGTTPWSRREHAVANPDHPAVYISWNDVQEFIGRLNMASGEEIFRLPTEAEWEYTCRAGTTTRWSFGDDEGQLKHYAWYWENASNLGRRYAQPVGQKRPNPWGLYDVHGNVSEWCQDWSESYSSGAQTDPTGPSSGTYRAIRGGSFDTDTVLMGSAIRGSNSPDGRDYYTGVRLLRVAESAVPPNRAPEADAGADQLVEVGATVQLDGNGSWDVNVDTLSYRWTVPAEISLSDATVASPTFVADTPGTYRIGLVVNDGQADSAPDEVAVMVISPDWVKELTVDLPGDVTMEFVWIDRGFWLGKYELTQRHWNAVMGTTSGSGEEVLDYPKVYISWNDVQQFIRYLNKLSGEVAFRLPTAVEWEYACRAGTTTRWSFGDEKSWLEEYAWYEGNTLDVGEPYAHAVGTKFPNPWGLYDMYGNVLEWCQDRYDDPLDPFRVAALGGAFNSPAQVMLTYRPFHDLPTEGYHFHGARLLRVAEPAVFLNTAPEANAGENRTVAVGTTVHLYGGSRDADGDELTHRWTAPSGVELSSTTEGRPTFTARAVGVYRFRLVVNDGQVNSAADEVVVTVVEAIASPGPETMVTTPAGSTHEMILVAAGHFIMGPRYVKPANLVYLDGFYIDKYEVTNAQFSRFVEDTGHVTTAEETGSSWVSNGPIRGQVSGAKWNAPQGPESNVKRLMAHPVIHVSWLDAQAYCTWAGLRLPNEAKWEKAARGTDGRRYPWGEEIQWGRANYGSEEYYGFPDDSDGYDFTAPVGHYPAGRSPYGVYDMAGNVWEWVAASPSSEPSEPSSDSRQELRGGSWSSDSLDLLTYGGRGEVVPTATGNQSGFRCARDF